MSYKTSRQKTAAVAMVGVVVAAALAAAISFAPIAASAQERPASDVNIHKFRTASGAGVATATDSGEDFRSGIRAIWTYNNSTDERTMTRGSIVISVDEERVGYQFVADTWDLEVAEDGLTFEASGQVENSDGEVFDVSLDGYLGGPVGFVRRAGTTWSVDGQMTGENAEYDLHYVIIAHLGRLAVVEE
jgi:hypothetical protein